MFAQAHFIPANFFDRVVTAVNVACHQHRDVTIKATVKSECERNEMFPFHSNVVLVVGVNKAS